MKFTETSVALLSVAGLVTAQPHHKHSHRHAHEKRGVQILPRDNPVALAFEYDGQLMNEQSVCKGIRDGSLKWAAGTQNPPDCAIKAAAPKPAAPVAAAPVAAKPVTSATTSKAASPTGAAGNNFFQAASSQAASSSSSTTAVKSIPTLSSGSTGSSSSSNSGMSGILSKLATNSGVNKPFPNGQISCSDFPGEYGAIPIDWMQLDGWSGIQYVPSSRTKIDTAVAGGAGCSSTDAGTTYCSYACPFGYQKSQWPEQQGATGESIGGLECKADGKLYLTNPGLSNSLCIQGSENVEVKNELSEIACICRTDYPGTENEVVPLLTLPGSTNPLTCPLEESYYHHEGLATSAQYYLNRKGIPVDEACQWGEDGSSMGNFAPVTLGAGTDASGTTWLSIQSTRQNNPKKFMELDFTVEIVSDSPGASTCFLVNKNGKGLFCTKGSPANFSESDCKYYSLDSSDPHGASVPGCTVGVSGGTATYVLTPSI